MRSLSSGLRAHAGLLALLLSLAAAATVPFGEAAPAWLGTTARAAATFTVNSTGDGADSNTSDGVCNDGAGNCTLRAAIEQANATAGADTIAFNIPGAGVKTIDVPTSLPLVSGPATIDGYTQPGSSPNTLADGDNAVILIELRGPGQSSASGLFLSANITVRGLSIYGFTGQGSGGIVTGGNCVVEGNFIGTDATGLPDASGAPRVAGNFHGVSVNGTNNTIGGTSPAARNLISGNTNHGVNIATGSSSTGNVIRGNFIGTDATGTRKLGNGAIGVLLGGRNGLTTLGGTAPGARNVISGNGSTGVLIQPGYGINIPPTGNTVEGNYIGTDVSGTKALGNLAGLRINFGANNTIGGAEATSGNLISGNTQFGVSVGGDQSRNNQFGGNRIGTDASGTRPLGNGGHGIELVSSVTNNTIQPMGPSAPPNTVAFNAENGIVVAGSSNIPIRRNQIFSNGQLGIDLNDDGVTPNDAGDTDFGGNHSQNFPLITSVSTGGSTTNVQGALNSQPERTYMLDFYSNSACDPSGHGEGARFFGETSVTTDTGGNAAFNVTFPTPLPPGRIVTATATDETANQRNTSEFSPCSPGGAAGSAEFSAAAYNVNENIGSATITLVRTGGTTGALTVNFATEAGTATPGADYTETATTLTFADGETTKTVSVPLVNDGATEPTETVNLILFNLSDPDAAGAQGRAVLNILDSNQPSVVSIGDVTVTEGLSGTTTAVFTLTLSAATASTVSADFQTADDTATAPADYASTGGTVFFAPGATTANVSVTVNGDTLDEPTETFFVNLTNPTNATLGDSQGVGTILNNDTPVLQFATATFSTSEGNHGIGVTVNRSGRTDGELTVDYATTDGTASERKDYTTALGTLRFAAGEAGSKAFTVLLTDDGFQESDETIVLTLSNPTGGAALAGNSTSVLTITDNDAAPSPTNPIDETTFFVRRQYHDFLNREPDSAGLAFWVNNIESCGANAACREVKRIDTSAAFFLSIEFQATGYFVYRLHQVAFNTGPRLKLRAFLRDAQTVGRGVIVTQPDAEQQLEANRRAFVNEFITRPEFVALYPQTLTAAQYVDALNANTGNSLTPAERDALVGDLTTGAKTRAEVLRQVAENRTFFGREFNRAFVLEQYFGYLRRNPDDAPEPGLNFDGYNFWLSKLDQFGGDFRRAEMVKAFIISGEYRGRFR